MRYKLFLLFLIATISLYTYFSISRSYYDLKAYMLNVVHPKNEIPVILFKGYFEGVSVVPPSNYSLPQEYQSVIILLNKTSDISAIYHSIFLVDGLNIFIVKVEDPYHPKVLRHKIYNLSNYSVWRAGPLDTFDYFRVNNKYIIFYYTNYITYVPCDYYTSTLVGALFDINLTKLVLLYVSDFPTKCFTLVGKKIIYNNKTYYFHSRNNKYIIFDKDTLYFLYESCKKTLCLIDVSNLTNTLVEGTPTDIIGKYIEIAKTEGYITYNTLYRYRIEGNQIILEEELSQDLQEITSKMPDICKPLPNTFKLEDPDIIIFPIYGDVYESGECKASIETKNITLVHVRKYDGTKVSLIYEDFIKGFYYNITHYSNGTYVLSLEYANNKYFVDDKAPEGFWGPYIYPTLKLIEDNIILETIRGFDETFCYKIYYLEKIQELSKMKWYCIKDDSYSGEIHIVDTQLPFSYILIMRGFWGPYVKKYPPYGIIVFQENLTKEAESINDIFKAQFVIQYPIKYASPFRVTLYILNKIDIEDLILFTDKPLWIAGFYFNNSIYIKAESNLSSEIDKIIVEIIDENSNNKIASYIFDSVSSPVLYKISFPYNKSSYIINATIYDEGYFSSFIFEVKWFEEEQPQPQPTPTPSQPPREEEGIIITKPKEEEVLTNISNITNITYIPKKPTGIQSVIIWFRNPLVLLTVSLIIILMIYLTYRRK